MDVNALISMLTDGLDPAEAAVVSKAIQRDATKAKVAAIKAAEEVATIETERLRLQAELNGEGEPGKQGYKPGSKAYREWYEKNYPAIKANADAIATYEAKHGEGSFAKAVNGEAPPVNPTNPNAKSYTPEEIQTMVDSRVRDQYGPQWTNHLLKTSTIVQKHMFAGRKNPIDMQKVAELANAKYNGDLELAYDEWDKPERDRIAKEDEDKRVDQRVKDELQKRGASLTFPAAADMTPSALSNRSKADLDKFDATSLKNELARDWMNAGTTAA